MGDMQFDWVKQKRGGPREITHRILLGEPLDHLLIIKVVEDLNKLALPQFPCSNNKLMNYFARSEGHTQFKN